MIWAKVTTGEILAAVVVDDANVLAALHQRANAVERHVAAGLDVVELAVAVALDQAHLVLPSWCRAHPCRDCAGTTPFARSGKEEIASPPGALTPAGARA